MDVLERKTVNSINFAITDKNSGSVKKDPENKSKLTCPKERLQKIGKRIEEYAKTGDTDVVHFLKKLTKTLEKVSLEKCSFLTNERNNKREIHVVGYSLKTKPILFLKFVSTQSRNRNFNNNSTDQISDKSKAIKAESQNMNSLIKPPIKREASHTGLMFQSKVKTETSYQEQKNNSDSQTINTVIKSLVKTSNTEGNTPFICQSVVKLETPTHEPLQNAHFERHTNDSIEKLPFKKSKTFDSNSGNMGYSEKSSKRVLTEKQRVQNEESATINKSDSFEEIRKMDNHNLLPKSEYINYANIDNNLANVIEIDDSLVKEKRKCKLNDMNNHSCERMIKPRRYIIYKPVEDNNYKMISKVNDKVQPEPDFSNLMGMKITSDDTSLCQSMVKSKTSLELPLLNSLKESHAYNAIMNHLPRPEKLFCDERETLSLNSGNMRHSEENFVRVTPEKENVQSGESAQLRDDIRLNDEYGSSFEDDIGMNEYHLLSELEHIKDNDKDNAERYQNSESSETDINSGSSIIVKPCYVKLTRLEYPLIRSVENVTSNDSFDSDTNKRHSCPCCNKSFIRKDSFNLHLAIHKGIKLFPCKTCFNFFYFRHEVKEHEHYHTRRTLLHACLVCKKRFGNKKALNKHKQFHVTQHRYSCPECEKKFSHVYYLKIHKRIHRIQRPYACTVCGSSFTRESILQNHIKEHQGNELVYKCNSCNTYFSQTKLQLHKCQKLIDILMQKENKIKRCNFCNKKFKTKRGLRLHSCFLIEDLETLYNIPSVKSSGRKTKSKINRVSKDSRILEQLLKTAHLNQSKRKSNKFLWPFLYNNSDVKNKSVCRTNSDKIIPEENSSPLNLNIKKTKITTSSYDEELILRRGNVDSENKMNGPNAANLSTKLIRREMSTHVLKLLNTINKGQSVEMESIEETSEGKTRQPVENFKEKPHEVERMDSESCYLNEFSPREKRGSEMISENQKKRCWKCSACGKTYKRELKFKLHKEYFCVKKHTQQPSDRLVTSHFQSQRTSEAMRFSNSTLTIPIFQQSKQAVPLASLPNLTSFNNLVRKPLDETCIKNNMDKNKEQDMLSGQIKSPLTEFSHKLPYSSTTDKCYIRPISFKESTLLESSRFTMTSEISLLSSRNMSKTDFQLSDCNVENMTFHDKETKSLFSKLKIPERLPYIFASNKSFDLNYPSPSNVKPRYSCKFCDKPFITHLALTTHLNRVHLIKDISDDHIIAFDKKSEITSEQIISLNEHKPFILPKSNNLTFDSEMRTSTHSKTAADYVTMTTNEQLSTCKDTISNQDTIQKPVYSVKIETIDNIPSVKSSGGETKSKINCISKDSPILEQLLKPAHLNQSKPKSNKSLWPFLYNNSDVMNKSVCRTNSDKIIPEENSSPLNLSIKKTKVTTSSYDGDLILRRNMDSENKTNDPNATNLSIKLIRSEMSTHMLKLLNAINRGRSVEMESIEETSEGKTMQSVENPLKEKSHEVVRMGSESCYLNELSLRKKYSSEVTSKKQKEHCWKRSACGEMYKWDLNLKVQKEHLCFEKTTQYLMHNLVASYSQGQRPSEGLTFFNYASIPFMQQLQLSVPLVIFANLPFFNNLSRKSLADTCIKNNDDKSKEQDMLIDKQNSTLTEFSRSSTTGRSYIKSISFKESTLPESNLSTMMSKISSPSSRNILTTNFQMSVSKVENVTFHDEETKPLFSKLKIPVRLPYTDKPFDLNYPSPSNVKPRYLCKFCDKPFISHLGLTAHLNRVHLIKDISDEHIIAFDKKSEKTSEQKNSTNANEYFVHPKSNNLRFDFEMTTSIQSKTDIDNVSMIKYDEMSTCKDTISISTDNKFPVAQDSLPLSKAFCNADLDMQSLKKNSFTETLCPLTFTKSSKTNPDHSNVPLNNSVIKSKLSSNQSSSLSIAPYSEENLLPSTQGNKRVANPENVSNTTKSFIPSSTIEDTQSSAFTGLDVHYPNRSVSEASSSDSQSFAKLILYCKNYFLTQQEHQVQKIKETDFNISTKNPDPSQYEDDIVIRPCESCSVEMQNGKEELKSICEACERRFCCKTRMRDHRKMYRECNWTCFSCGKRFAEEVDKMCHEEKLCLRKYPELRNKKESDQPKPRKKGSKEKREPAQFKSFVCNYCGKNFKRRDRFKHHLLNHEEPHRFLCHICPKKFRTKSGLEDHLLDHDGIKSFQCPACLEYFTSKTSLSNHKRTVHIDETERRKRNERRFECEFCGKKYTTTFALDIHVRCHTGDKPFKCTECSKSFRTQYILDIHIKYAHTNERKFKCEHCDKTFVTKYNMKIHTQSHFKEKAKKRTKKKLQDLGFKKIKDS